MKLKQNLNVHCERFVFSIKSECLDRLILFGEVQLRQACTEFLAHYHGERPHQGLENKLIDGSALAANDNGEIMCSECLGGLLKFYHRGAA